MLSECVTLGLAGQTLGLWAFDPFIRCAMGGSFHMGFGGAVTSSAVRQAYIRRTHDTSRWGVDPT